MKAHVIVIDNFDSFTYNLVDELLKQGAQTTVFRNDVSLETLQAYIQKQSTPVALLISPGPDAPEDSGNCLAFVDALKGTIPIFGICLGHQVIGQAFGGKVYQVDPVHGEASFVNHTQHDLFSNIPDTFEAGRYHSLAVTCPEDFKIIASSNQMVMAMAHDTYPIYGLQFHPESILTNNGAQIIHNILNLSMQEVGYARA